MAATAILVLTLLCVLIAFRYLLVKLHLNQCCCLGVANWISVYGYCYYAIDTHCDRVAWKRCRRGNIAVKKQSPVAPFAKVKTILALVPSVLLGKPCSTMIVINDKIRMLRRPRRAIKFLH
ncbi:hypothetical protein BDB00DRAFT_789227 [Zychaea mexicana]|uniref:uncharacterized protein n=1 Tax=Zychaea mexicana TaxID=64656 RepID=UPI0022FF02EF|nr:uncharacterized protein BDB00DRAFT_789227 [Zychaea mexicana]KAI9491915.1 hypothetical protein BDB00DRAFT_789227 [Zychaea mexicana]